MAKEYTPHDNTFTASGSFCFFEVDRLLFQNMIAHLKAVVRGDYVSLQLEKDGISITEMDTPHICAVYYRLREDVLKLYRLSDSCPFKEVPIETDRMHQMLSLLKSSHSKRLLVFIYKDSIRIVTQNEESVRMAHGASIKDAHFTNPKIKDITYPFCLSARVPASVLYGFSNSFFAVLRVICIHDTLYLVSDLPMPDGEFEKRIPLTEENTIELNTDVPFESRFNTEYLFRNMPRYLKDVVISFGDDTPLRVTGMLGRESSVIYIIAPRIER